MYLTYTYYQWPGIALKVYAGKPSSAQFQPAEVAAITQHRYTGQDQPSALHLATRDGGDLVGKRLSESSINKLETFKQHSRRSEFTEKLPMQQASQPINQILPLMKAPFNSILCAISNLTAKVSHVICRSIHR